MQTGVFYCMRAAARQLLPQGSGQRRQHLLDPRILAESGPRGLLRDQGRGADDDPRGSRRVGGSGVRVNAIAPGIQRTPMWDADVARGAIDEPFYLRTVPMGRIGDPARGRPAGRLPLLRRRRLRHGRLLHDRRRTDVDSRRLRRPGDRGRSAGERTRMKTWPLSRHVAVATLDPRTLRSSSASASAWPRAAELRSRLRGSCRSPRSRSPWKSSSRARSASGPRRRPWSDERKRRFQRRFLPAATALVLAPAPIARLLGGRRHGGRAAAARRARPARRFRISRRSIPTGARGGSSTVMPEVVWRDSISLGLPYHGRLIDGVQLPDAEPVLDDLGSRRSTACPTAATAATAARS